MVLRMHEPELLFLFADQNGIARRYFDMHLTITGQLRIGAVVGADDNLNFRIAIEHNRPGGQGVGEHRHHHDGVQ